MKADKLCPDIRGGGPMEGFVSARQKRHALETVPDQKKTNSRDAIIEVTACLICDSDLHIYNNVIPEMEMGDVMRPGDSSR